VTTARCLPPETGYQDLEAQFRLYPLAKGKRSHGDSIEERTGLSRDLLEAEAKSGRLKVTRVGGRVMVRAENLLAWLESCEEEPVVIRGRRRRDDRKLRAQNLAEFREIRDRVRAETAGRRP